MTVGRMRSEMPQSEYVKWTVYYNRKAQRRELEALKAKATAGDA